MLVIPPVTMQRKKAANHSQLLQFISVTYASGGSLALALGAGADCVGSQSILSSMLLMSAIIFLRTSSISFIFLSSRLIIAMPITMSHGTYADIYRPSRTVQK
jgi:hypothetical protein